MWQTYSSRNKYLPDFIVKYRFYKPEEGGRKTVPFQGYRSDFSYAGDDPIKDGIYMIHPEFLDENMIEILYDNQSVPIEGYAYMWILIPEMRITVHVNRLKVGILGYFMEGSRKVGELEVIKLIGLYDNIKIT